MQDPEIDWDADDVPISRRYADRYYSAQDGLAESRHVFLKGNGLPERFAEGFSIAELGFGTGLNFLAAWLCWDRAQIPGRLKFTSFELAPLSCDKMRRAVSRWPELAPHAERLARNWRPGGGVMEFGSAVLELVCGDARKRLPQWAGSADAWFLDGFAPARNPQMWEPGLLTQVVRLTRPGGRFATYSAAGSVRRSLAAAGFEVQKRPGYGTKREMCCGTLA